MPKKRPAPIDRLDSSIADRVAGLPADERRAVLREVEALRVDLERDRRARDRGDLSCFDVPDWLARVDAESPGAARLYYALPSPCTAERAAEVGARLGMGPAAVASALAALRRAELLLDGPDGFTVTALGSQPF